MKTAMQDFIDNIIPMHVIQLPIIKNAIKKALEKEKEQIMDAYSEGYSDGVQEPNPNDEYYNQTYKP